MVVALLLWTRATSSDSVAGEPALYEARFDAAWRGVPLEAHRHANAPSHWRGGRRQLDEADAAPLRIHLEYFFDPGAEVSLETQQRIKEVMPLVVSQLQRTVKVRRPVPPSTRLVLPKQCSSSWLPSGKCRTVSSTPKCGELVPYNSSHFGAYEVCPTSPNRCTTEGDENGGVPDADMVVYVTADDRPGPCRSKVALAYAGYCALDPWDERPVAGYVNLCKHGMDRQEGDNSR